MCSLNVHRCFKNAFRYKKECFSYCRGKTGGAHPHSQMKRLQIDILCYFHVLKQTTTTKKHNDQQITQQGYILTNPIRLLHV